MVAPNQAAKEKHGEAIKSLTVAFLPNEGTMVPDGIAEPPLRPCSQEKNMKVGPMKGSTIPSGTVEVSSKNILGYKWPS